MVGGGAAHGPIPAERNPEGSGVLEREEQIRAVRSGGHGAAMDIF